MKLEERDHEIVDAPPTVFRSALMGKVKGRNTRPEVKVRRAIHSSGFRFRLHRKDLPGRPDIVLPRHQLVIFVHGCFWHRHAGCKMTTTPKTRRAFWEEKFAANVLRDQRNIDDLKKLGWRVATIWECEVLKPEKLRSALAGFLTIKNDNSDRLG